MNRKTDIILGVIFTLLSITFVFLFLSHEAFFEWAYWRHTNQLSFYVRPLFLLAFALASYKKTWFGMSGMVLCTLTSMFWFPAPASPSPAVVEFLQMEMEWIKSPFSLQKSIMVACIPLAFLLIGYIFYHRKLWLGMGIFSLSVVGKIIWSLYSSDNGYVIILPAVIGIIIGGYLIKRLFWGNKTNEGDNF